jgi:hypothetical protein
MFRCKVGVCDRDYSTRLHYRLSIYALSIHLLFDFLVTPSLSPVVAQFGGAVPVRYFWYRMDVLWHNGGGSRQSSHEVNRLAQICSPPHLLPIREIKGDRLSWHHLTDVYWPTLDSGESTSTFS